MKYLSTFCVVIFIFLPWESSAQGHNWFGDKKPNKKHWLMTDTLSRNQPFNSFFIEPISLIDLWNGNGTSFRVGTERHIGKDWAVSVTGGVYLLLARGWMTKAELKRYLPITQPGFKDYISLEYFYRQTTSTRSDSVFNPPDYLANFTVSKFITGLRLKVGSVQLVTHHLFLEWYAGAGIKYRNVVSTLPQSQYQYIHTGDDGNPGEEDEPYTFTPVKAIRPDITAGIRLGLRY